MRKPEDPGVTPGTFQPKVARAAVHHRFGRSDARDIERPSAPPALGRQCDNVSGGPMMSRKFAKANRRAVPYEAPQEGVFVIATGARSLLL
jgi:hypothetical protein